MQISNTKDIRPESMFGMIYAPSGFGKTVLGGTLPKESTLIVSCENGLLSLREQGMDFIELDPARRIAHLREVISFLMSNPDKKYKTIFVDGLAELSEAFLKEAEMKFPDKSQALPKYGEYDRNFRAFLKALRDLKLNVFLTALMKEKKETGASCFYPDIVGKISTQIPAFCDLVVSIVMDESGRKLLTAPLDGHVCKDRSGKLNPMEEMNLSAVINKIFKKEKENAN